MSAQPDTDYSQTPGLKKKCSSCGTWFPYSTNHFYAKKERTREGKLRLDSWCKTCRNIKNSKVKPSWHHESEQAAEKRKAKLRALQRARIRVANLYPEVFDELVVEEMRKEGWEPGDDLRKWANRKKGKGQSARVCCRARKRCGWIGTRKIKSGNLTKPCPWCGGVVGRP